jgi:5-methylcytosine-specific restriction endonuclease McrA
MGFSKPPYQVVIHTDPLSGISWTDTPGGACPVPPATLEKALCDAEIIDLADVEGNPTWELRELEGATGEVEQSIESGTGNALQTAISSGGSDVQVLTVEEVNALYRKCKKENKGRKGRRAKMGRTVRKRRTISPALRQKIFLLAGHRCQRCGSRMFLVIHHLHPVAAGGEMGIVIIALICQGCHDLAHSGKIDLSDMLRTHSIVRVSGSIYMLSSVASTNISKLRTYEREANHGNAASGETAQTHPLQAVITRPSGNAPKDAPLTEPYCL